MSPLASSSQPTKPMNVRSGDEKAFLTSASSGNSEAESGATEPTQPAVDKKRNLEATKKGANNEHPLLLPKAARPPAAKKTRRSTAAPATSSNTLTEPTLHSELTTVEGQMAKNPNLTTEEAKEAAKREYNKRNAARARVRSKRAVAGLHEKCDRLEKHVRNLTRENAVLRTKLDFFKEQDQRGQGQEVAACLTGNSRLPSSVLGHQALGDVPSYDWLQAMANAGTYRASSTLDTTSLLRENLLTRNSGLGSAPPLGLALADSASSRVLLQGSSLSPQQQQQLDLWSRIARGPV